MIFILSAAATLVLGGGVIAVYAACTAPDGYEDASGFHPLAADGARRPADKVGETLPPFASAR